MNRFTRLSAAVLSCVMLSALCACGKTDTTAPDNGKISPTTASVVTTTRPSTDPSATTAPTETTKTTVADTPAPDVESQIVAHFATVQEIAAFGFDEPVISDSEYAMPVLIEAVGDVFDVCVIELEVTMDEAGMYKQGDIFKIGNMTNGEKKTVLIDFPGDMSAWGLTYVDNMNELREHTLYMSGEDGSLVMTEGIM